MANEPQTILDSCVLINLAASNEIADIVSSIAGPTLICTAVQREALFLRDEADPGVLVPLSVDDLVAVARIRVCDVETADEEEQFVRLAGDLDDGEAMSIAIADSRGMQFASDDQKARRVFLELGHTADRLTCTSAIVRRWAETRSIPSQRLKATLRRITVRARFTPSRRDPHVGWWQQHSVA
jgi:predicted nucleic acid-binding protein